MRFPILRTAAVIPAGGLFGRLSICVRKLIPLLPVAVAVASGCVSPMIAADAVAPIPEARRGHFVTRVEQFRNLSGADYLVGCDFRLNGVVTLVDTNRD